MIPYHLNSGMEYFKMGDNLNLAHVNYSLKKVIKLLVTLTVLMTIVVGINIWDVMRHDTEETWVVRERLPVTTPVYNMSLSDRINNLIKENNKRIKESHVVEDHVLEEYSSEEDDISSEEDDLHITLPPLPNNETLP